MEPHAWRWGYQYIARNHYSNDQTHKMARAVWAWHARCFGNFQAHPYLGGLVGIASRTGAGLKHHHHHRIDNVRSNRPASRPTLFPAVVISASVGSVLPEIEVPFIKETVDSVCEGNSLPPYHLASVRLLPCRELGSQTRHSQLRACAFFVENKDLSPHPPSPSPKLCWQRLESERYGRPRACP